MPKQFIAISQAEWGLSNCQCPNCGDRHLTGAVATWSSEKDFREAAKLSRDGNLVPPPYIEYFCAGCNKSYLVTNDAVLSNKGITHQNGEVIPTWPSDETYIFKFRAAT